MYTNKEIDRQHHCISGYVKFSFVLFNRKKENKLEGKFRDLIKS